MIKIYTTQTCHFCHEAKDFLNDYKVEYIEIDVTGDKDTIMNVSGQTGVPVIQIDDKILIGFSEPMLRRELNI